MRRDFGARRTALGAVFAALSLVILWLGCLAPSGRLGMAALSGLVPAAAVVSGGMGAGFLCYGACGLLTLLLVPDKGMALLYVLFFGLYPMVKSLAERRKSWAAGLCIKLAFFNLVLAVFLLFLRGMFLALLPGALAEGNWLVWPVGNAVFLAYDYGFSRLISFYMARVQKR